MELIQLELKGFRGFKNKQVIQFPQKQQPLVFVGVNGAGKTALLDAIRAALTPFGNWLIYGSDRALGVVETLNINLDKESAEIILNWFYPIESEKTKYTSHITVNRDIEPHFKFEGATQLLSLISDIKSNISHYKNEYSIGLMAYYPSERLVLDADVEEDLGQTFNQLDALVNGFASFIDFKTFFRWFRQTEDIENEQRLTENNTYTEPKLQAVRNAIMAFLDGFSDLRIQRSPVADMVVKKGGKKLSVNQLSSGEKSLLTMIGDLARRLAIANPGLKNPLEGRGVVLIDEVDLHLHPTWQTEIVARLQRTFPKIQFILTTHSPLIINRLPLESLYFLKDNECFPATQSDLVTYGADILKILAWQGVVAVLPEEISEKINEIDHLIKSNNLEKAKEKLAALKKLTDPLHADILSLETDLEIKALKI